MLHSTLMEEDEGGKPRASSPVPQDVQVGSSEEVAKAVQDRSGTGVGGIK